MDTVDDILMHYGKKGMRWGVRKAVSNGASGSPDPVIVRAQPGKKLRTSGGKRQPPSEDAKSHAAKKQLAKKSGLQALSDKDLRDLNNRLGMEKKYRDSIPKTPTKKAVEFVGKFLVQHAQKEMVGLRKGEPGPVMSLLSQKKLAAAKKAGTP